MMTDPIADMLTRMRNSLSVGKRETVVPFSKIKMAILGILVAEGYLDSAAVTGENKRDIAVHFKYNGRTPALQSLTRISKPGHRRYIKAEEIKPVLNGFGLAILSTPKGVLTDKAARAAKVGGELLCEIY